jgi:hypothetical protein
MIPGTYDLAIYRGDTGKWQFKLWTDANKTVPANLTGMTVAAMIRDKTTGGVFSLSMGCVVTMPNIIDMTLPAADSRTVPAKGFWDLQLTHTPSGDITTVLKGAVNVTSDVTYVDGARTAARARAAAP